MAERKTTARRPRVLVLEALHGAGSCIWRAGGVPIVRDPRWAADKTIRTIESDGWDALLLTGGGDVDPRYYGQRPHKKVYGVNEIRDDVEDWALMYAENRRVPVLGICRGAQMINVFHDGTLKQHIAGHRGDDHFILTVRGSLLRRAAPQRHKLVVSLHHQEVGRLGDGLVVCAKAYDGTVEAIESTDGRILGVQFHPEMDARAAYARGIFRWLVLAAAQRAGLSTPSLPKSRRASQRPAGRAPKPKRHLPSTVTTSWMCPHCAMRFDHVEDREDHVMLLHNSTRSTPTEAAR